MNKSRQDLVAEKDAIEAKIRRLDAKDRFKLVKDLITPEKVTMLKIHRDRLVVGVTDQSGELLFTASQGEVEESDLLALATQLFAILNARLFENEAAARVPSPETLAEPGMPGPETSGKDG